MNMIKKIKESQIRAKLLIILGVLLVVFIAFFIGFNMKYENLFYDKTYINGIDISDMTINEASEYITHFFDEQKLEILDNQGNTTLYSLKDDFDVSYELENFLTEVKNDEESLNIITKLFSEKKYSIKDLKINEEKFNEIIKESDFYKSGLEDKTTNANQKYDENSKKFIVQNEYQGTNINLEDFLVQIENLIAEGNFQVDLSSGNYYVNPTVLSDDQDLLAKIEAFNNYIGASITYEMSNGNEVCDASVYGDWLSYDGKEVTLKSSKVKKYVKELANQYDTVGKTREFKTTSGTTKSFASTSFGFKINQSEEVEKLTSNIVNKEVVTREPEYSQREISGNNGFGYTYVEIDLTNQKVYLYKNGNLVLTTNCVTGNESKGYNTPSGIYKIKYKQSPAVLKGAIDPETGEREYESPVTYWMPFNGGIGLHDATWRSNFGGEIYKTNGSHGCVNLPISSAATIYANVSSGTPVILYH